MTETVHAISAGTTTLGIVGSAGERLALKVGSTLAWTLFDAHGDLAGLLDSAGAYARTLRYSPYGELVAEYAAQGSFASPWRYQGALDVNDPSAPLYDIGARFYSPSVGAWTQACLLYTSDAADE